MYKSFKNDFLVLHPVILINCSPFPRGPCHCGWASGGTAAALCSLLPFRTPASPLEEKHVDKSLGEMSVEVVVVSQPVWRAVKHLLAAEMLKAQVVP